MTLKLESIEWHGFFIEEFAEIKSGVRLTKADMTTGLKPFIGSTDSNNGITHFVSDENRSEDSNILEVNYNRSEEHTSELQSRPHLVCRLLLEKKKKKKKRYHINK